MRRFPRPTVRVEAQVPRATLASGQRRPEPGPRPSPGWRPICATWPPRVSGTGSPPSFRAVLSGDTFGISILPAVSKDAPERISLTWGSAIKGHKHSQIYGAVVTLPHQFYTGG